MSTFVTSRGTRVQHVSPKCQSQPYQLPPWQREWKHGRIQDDLPKMNRLWFWMRFVIMVPVTVYALKLAVVG